MAQCSLSPKEFIQNAFNPVVAVACTARAESVCQKNDLNFIDMIQPFCKLQTEVQLRDPMNQQFTISNMRISMADMQYEPPKQVVSRKMLYEVVAGTLTSPAVGSRMVTLKTDEYSLQVSNSTPWFEAYRDRFLKIAAVSDHEFLGHFLACIFVVSVRDDDPMQEFSKLNLLQHSHQHQSSSKASKWFFPSILKYYVLLQDLTDNDNPSKVESLYATLKTTYGVNTCHLLQVNSRDFHNMSANEQAEALAGMTDPWTQFLTPRANEMETNDLESDTPSPIGQNESGGITGFYNSESLSASEASSPTSDPDVMDHPLMPHHPSARVSATPTAGAVEMGGLPLDGLFGQNVSAFPTSSSSSAYDIGGDIGSPYPKDIPSNHPLNRGAKRSNGLSQFPHGVCITSADQEHIRQLVKDFCLKALLPFVEKQLSSLHEVVANRKGLHRSFLSATKKWFSGNKPVPVATSTPTTFVVYSPEAVELQVRRLGDLAFLFQHYELAYHAYHTVKRDFNSDQAWMHYAGSLEMAALSVFMQGVSSQRQLPIHYIDNAITTYLNTCKSPQFATRATMLTVECLKHQEKYLDAANYFIRLTSEDSDLRSALLLEQAAHCFVCLKNVCVRKYAFYLILAGHRFNKAGQKRHSLRCYRQAMEVYRKKQWTLAEDHINLTAGRLNFNLNQLEDAVKCFNELLHDDSMQGTSQQTYYLREFLAICSHLLDHNVQSTILSSLPLPVIDAQNQLRIILDDPSATEDAFVDLNNCNEPFWAGLEEAAVVRALGSIPVMHQPSVYCLTADTDNSRRPFATVGQGLTVQLTVRNPLKIALTMTEVHLQWTFTPPAGPGDAPSEPISNEDVAAPGGGDKKIAGYDVQRHGGEPVETSVLSELTIESLQSQQISLSLVPRAIGELSVTGLAYSLTTLALPAATATTNGQGALPLAVEVPTSGGGTFSVRGRQPLKVRGPRLMPAMKEENEPNTYGADFRLQSVVLPAMPKLVVTFHDFPGTLLCGQVAPFALHVENRGPVGLSRLLLATTTPELLTLGRPSTSLSKQPGAYVYSSYRAPTVARECATVTPFPLPDGMDQLLPGHDFWIPAWISGPPMGGTHTLYLLFYYETAAGGSQRLRHRVLRRQVTFTTQELLSASAIALNGTQQSRDDFQQNVTVALELSNCHQSNSEKPTLLRLAQISCVSKRWTIESIDCSYSNNLNIGSKETLHLCLRAVEKAASLENEEASRDTLQFSNISYQEMEIDCSAGPCYDFYLRSNYRPLGGDKPKDDAAEKLLDADRNSSATLDLTLVLLWKVSGDSGEYVSHGQHHLRLDDTGTVVSTSVEPKATEARPLLRFFANSELTPAFGKTLEAEESSCPQRVCYYLFASSEVRHDFSTSSSCIVPVTLVLYNYAEFEVEIAINTNKCLELFGTPSAAATSAKGASGPLAAAEACRFLWVGCSRTTVSLGAHRARSVSLQACFFHHGTYSLNGVGISVRASAKRNLARPLTVDGQAQVVIVWDEGAWSR